MVGRRRPWISFVTSKPYLIAVGEVITQWAYFETEFNQVIHFMRLDRKAKALIREVPYSFNKRLTLVKDSAKLCFGSCPPLIDRLRLLRIESKRIKKTRDMLAHAQWHGNPEDGYLEVTLWNPGKIETKKIDLKMLRDMAVDISAMTRQLRNIGSAGLPFNDYSFPLTKDEQSALLEFRDRNLPPLPKPKLHL